MKSKQVWTLEWSAEQGCGHVTTLDDVMNINTRALLLGKVPNYILVGIFDDMDDALIAYDKFASMMKNVKRRKTVAEMELD